MSETTTASAPAVNTETPATGVDATEKATIVVPPPLASTTRAIPVGQDATYDDLFSKKPEIANLYLKNMQDPAEDNLEKIGMRRQGSLTAEQEAAKAVEVAPASKAPYGAEKDAATPAPVDAAKVQIEGTDLQALADDYFANGGKISDGLKRTLNGKGFANSAMEMALPMIERAFNENKAIVEKTFGSFTAYQEAIKHAEETMPSEYRDAAYTMLRDLRDPKKVQLGAEMLLKPYQLKVGPAAVQAQAQAQGARAPQNGMLMEGFKSESESSEWYRENIMKPGYERSIEPKALAAKRLFDQKLLAMTS